MNLSARAERLEIEESSMKTRDDDDDEVTVTVVGYELMSIIFVAMRRDRSRELSRARVERFDDGTLEGCRLHVQLGDVHDSVPEPGEFDSAAEFL